MKKRIINKTESKALFIIIASLYVLQSFLSVFIAFLLERLVDNAVQGIYQELQKTFIMVALYLVLVFVVTKTTFQLKNHYICKRNVTLQRTLIDNILKKKSGDFQKLGVGNIFAVFTNDLKLLEQNYYQSRFDLVSLLTTFIFGLCAMFVINWKVALGVIIASMVPMFFSTLYCMPLNHLQKKYSESYSQFSVALKNALVNFNLIKVFHLEDKAQQEVIYQCEKEENAKNVYIKRKELAQGYSGVLGSTVVFVVFGIGAILTIRGELQIGALLAFVQLMNYVLSPIEGIASEINNIKSCQSIIEKLDSIATEEYTTTKLPFPSCNKIVLHNVSYSFENKQVLHNINLVFERGKKYLIMGSNGSGKTTIINIIGRFYEDYEGELLFGDTEAKTIHATEFYQNVILLQQDVLILKDTIENNILLYKNPDPEDYQSIISKLNLSHLLANQTICDDNGNNLSGGEKQKIAAARALLRKPFVLLLDESFSALDPDTRTTVESALLPAADIVISVSHDRSEQNLCQYDEIIYVDDGKIITKGSYEEITKRIAL